MNIKFLNALLSLMIVTLLWFINIPVGTVQAAVYNPLDPWGYNHYFKKGRVLGMTFVRDESGNKIWSEYQIQGSEDNFSYIGDIGSAIGDFKDARALSADYLLSLKRQIVIKQTLFPDQTELLTASQYASTTFEARSGVVLEKPPIEPTTRSVLVRKRGLSIGSNYDDILLGQYPVDAHSITILDPSIQSVLVSEEGSILYSSQYNIGYKVAAVLWGETESEDEYIGGIGGVEVSAVDGSNTVTGPDGQFLLNYAMPPCPSFTYTMNSPAFAKYYYTSFDPRGEPVKSFTAERRETDSCFGLVELQAHMGGLTGAMLNTVLNGVMSSANISVYDTTTFIVELMMLNGQVLVANGSEQVPITGETLYNAKSSNLQNTAQSFYDFDGDNRLDHAVLGDFDAEGTFQANSDGAHQLIFLSSENEGALTTPAFTRLADSTQDLQHQGLLQTLSEADMKDTDIFVFRESNGMLVMKQNGAAGIAGGEFGINGNDAFYQIMFRGSSDDTFGYLFSQERYGGWAAKSNLNPKLHNRYSDFLRVGERIKIIAINRKTGYIGSATTTLRNATQPLEATGQQAPDLTTYIDPIIMGPPNLKIWAERVKRDTRGLTAGYADKYTVANEGSALDSDLMVAIFTEWYDQNGEPLPKELNGNGYTGRLAKIVGANTLGADTGGTSQFAIDPGKRLQLVKLHEEDITKQHFYVQVSAQPNSGNPDFSGSGAGSGPLQYRPKYYVPFKVPVYDETISLADKLYYNAEKDQLELTDPAAAEELLKPEPYYHWLYRPDYQFSVFDLDIKAINIAQSNGTVIDLKDSTSPTLSSSDQYLQLIYSLLGNDNDVLEGFGPDRELIFAFGEEEAHAYLGEDKTITFLNPEHLADLEPEDFLSVRLYQNSDAENVLWEWAFNMFDVLPASPAVVELNADQAFETPPSILGQVVSGSDNEGHTVQWAVSGDGDITPSVQSSVNGLFSSILTLPTVPGSATQVSGSLVGQGGSFSSALFLVTEAGRPAHMQLNVSGSSKIVAHGHYFLSGVVTDQFGNPVEDGTPIEIDAPGFQVESTKVTTNGQYSAKLFGLDKAGSYQVKVKAGSLEKSASLVVEDIPVSISMDDQISVGSIATVTFHANANDGTPIYIGNRRGRFVEDVVYVSGGIAIATLDAGSYRGYGFVTARIGTKVYQQDFNVTEDESAYLLDTVVVTGVDAPGSTTIEGRTVEYTPHTFLRLSGTPGETTDVSLIDYLNPPIAETLTFNEITAPSNTLSDLVQGKEADLYSTQWRHEGIYLNGSGSRISIPDVDIASIQAGLTLRFRAEGNGDLLTINDLGLKATLENQSLKVTVGGEELSSPAINFNQWHEVGIHWHQNKLVLQVNTHKVEIPFTNDQSFDGKLLIGGFVGSVNDINVYDWTAPAKIALADGNLTGQYTFDAEGKASVKVATNPAASQFQAQLRLNNQSDTFSVLPQAYASATGIDIPECKIKAPEDDPYFDGGVAMLEFLADCILKYKVAEAAVSYSQAGNMFTKSVAMVDVNIYFALYSQVYLAGNNARLTAECLQGALIGDSDSGAGMTCDFVTSIFAIGDVRDLIIHSYHYAMDNDEFDKATMVFATIGLAGSAASVGGVGVPVAVFAAGGKVIAKALKGAPVMVHMGDELYDLYVTQGKNVDEIVLRLEPLATVVAFVVLEGDSLVAVKDFVVEAINDKEDYDAWVKYTQAFFEKAASSLTAQNTSQSIINFFFAAAYAGLVDDIGTKAVRDLVKLMQQVQAQPLVGKITEGYRLPKEFTKAIKVLNETPDNKMKELLSGTDSEAIRGLLFVGSVGDKKALQKLLNYQGSVNISNDLLLASLNKLNDLVDHVDAENLEAVEKGLKKVFNQLQAGTDFNKSHGAANELYELAYRVQNKVKVVGVQVTKKIKARTRDLGNRIYDAQFKIGDNIVDIDKKAWSPKDLSSRLRNSLNYKAIDKEDATGQFGQLYKDLVKSGQDKPEFCCTRWVFDQRMLDHYGGVEQMKEGVAKMVEEIIEGNTQLKDRLMRDMGYNPELDTQIDDFDEKVIDRIKNLFETTPNIPIGN